MSICVSCALVVVVVIVFVVYSVIPLRAGETISWSLRAVVITDPPDTEYEQ